MYPELVYQVALTMIPQVGPVQAKILLQHCEVEELFHAKKSWLEKIDGIGPVRADAIKRFKDFSCAEKEIRFLEKNYIRPLFLSEKDYPKRLLNCYDSPTLLYNKGGADLNATRIIAVIGTRNNTGYGKQVTEKLIHELSAQPLTIVSGLAFGIDAIAHKMAMEFHLPTIGVMAHGMDQMYPFEHAALADEICSCGGGLLTEFRSGSKPDKFNFPSRNRIVAGMCDATIVIETKQKGGSIITAELANSYNRDVFAIPGRINDSKSAGCNYLIRNNKAILLNDAKEFMEMMGWTIRQGQNSRKIQRSLFIDLSPGEKIVIDLLSGDEPVDIDTINSRSGLSNSAVAAAILNLELQNVIVSLPGKLFRLA